jgi:hypothetical protein
MEVVKNLNYEQIRDSEAISETNRRTRAEYGELANTRQDIGQHRGRIAELPASSDKNTGLDGSGQTNFGAIRTESEPNGEGAFETVTDADHIYDHSDDYRPDRFDGNIAIQITDDIDDEAILGRNRRRKGMPRTNRR